MGTQRSAEDRFDEALRAWAEQPPRLAPTAAARAVVERLGDRGRRPPRLAWALATAAAVVLAAVGMVVVRVASPPLAPPQVGMVLATPTLSEGQVLIWLDDRTPLYMTYAAPEGGTR